MRELRRRLTGQVAQTANVVARRAAETNRGPRIAAAVRNQCCLVIGYHFAASADGAVNGEDWLLRRVGDRLDRFVDVGANVGRWSQAALSLGPEVRGIAIEAGEEAFAELGGRLDGRVDPINAAAGARTGEVTFFELPGASEWSSVVSPEVEGARARRVPVVTVDDVVRERGWPDVDILKIDTEGFDASVITGASGLLAEHRIGIVQFEYNASWARAGSTLGYELERFRAWGYETFALAPGGLTPVDYDRFGEFFRYANFVAVSPQWRSVVAPTGVDACP